MVKKLVSLYAHTHVYMCSSVMWHFCGCPYHSVLRKITNFSFFLQCSSVVALSLDVFCKVQLFIAHHFHHHSETDCYSPVMNTEVFRNSTEVMPCLYVK